MPRSQPRHHSGGGQPRSVQISKALSKLLRHHAQAEGIPVDSYGYVRMDRVLEWRGLRGMRGSGKEEVRMEDVVDCVGESEKMRFGLKYVGRGEEKGGDGDGGGDALGGEETRGGVVGGGKVINGGGVHGVDGGGKHRSEVDNQSEGKQEPNGYSPADIPLDEAAEVNDQHSLAEEQIETETQRAITMFTGGQDTDPKHFYIRANQGHSMKGVEAENLLVPITLDDEMIPETVVHGTFYGGWEGMLRSAGVKRMGRNHVHFSTGPGWEVVLKSLDEDGVEVDADQGKGREKKGRLSTLMDESKVVSGMRRDAQVLIYIDLRKALAEEKEMKWWRSENGVVLTEGKGEEGVVGMRYWMKVVEVKEGLGVLWEDGKVVKDLPGHLKGKPVPMGKGRGGGGAGRVGGGGGEVRRGGKDRWKGRSRLWVGEDGEGAAC